MRRIFKIFCILCTINLYGINHLYWILPISTTSAVELPLCTSSDTTYCGYGTLISTVVVVSYPPFSSTESSTDSTKSSVKYIPDRMYAKKYKKKYILTKDSLKECDDDKNSEVCYRYARIFNFLKYEEEAKKYYDLSCKYGLDIACDIDMQEDLKRENTTNYLKEYNLNDEIKDYDMVKQQGKNAVKDCVVLSMIKEGEMLWWSHSNVGVCYAKYEYALEHNDTYNIKYYKHALCMYGYEKYCDKAQDK